MGSCLFVVISFLVTYLKLSSGSSELANFARKWFLVSDKKCLRYINSHFHFYFWKSYSSTSSKSQTFQTYDLSWSWWASLWTLAQSTHAICRKEFSTALLGCIAPCNGYCQRFLSTYSSSGVEECWQGMSYGRTLHLYLRLRFQVHVS